MEEEASAPAPDDAERCGARPLVWNVGHAGKFTQSEMGKVQEEKASAQHDDGSVVEGGIINANPRQATDWDMVVSCVKMDFCD